MIYSEGMIWYLLLVDCIIYNIMTWTAGRWHTMEHHWISGYWKFDGLFGVIYAILTLWIGFALYRLMLLQFW